MPNRYRTDLASEACEQLGEELSSLAGVAVRRETLHGAPLLSVEITDGRAAERLDRAQLLRDLFLYVL